MDSHNSGYEWQPQETLFIMVSYGIWFVIVKLQTDDLAMAAENSLSDKNQRYKIKQGW